MKNVDMAHAPSESEVRLAGRVPRGWVVIGAALASWLVLVGVGTACTQVFMMIASHL